MGFRNIDIWEACKNGDLEYVKRYIDVGEDIEAKDPAWNRTPLSWASEWGHESVVRFLVKKGANPWGSIGYASARGFEEIVRFLAESGANINEQSNTGMTPLAVATRHKRENIVHLLVNFGCDINTQDVNGWSPMMNASGNGCDGIVRFLVENRADLTAMDNDGWTALFIALDNAQISVAEYLAPLMIQNPNIPYSGFPISSFIPKHKDLTLQDHAELVKKIMLIYVNRAIGDSKFGTDMQRDIKEILDGKIMEDREILTEKDAVLLTKFLKTLWSIDYTDRVSTPKRSGARQTGTKSDKNVASAYDMEL